MIFVGVFGSFIDARVKTSDFRALALVLVLPIRFVVLS